MLSNLGVHLFIVMDNIRIINAEHLWLNGVSICKFLELISV